MGTRQRASNIARAPEREKNGRPSAGNQQRVQSRFAKKTVEAIFCWKLIQVDAKRFGDRCVICTINASACWPQIASSGAAIRTRNQIRKQPRRAPHRLPGTTAPPSKPGNMCV